MRKKVLFLKRILREQIAYSLNQIDSSSWVLRFFLVPWFNNNKLAPTNAQIQNKFSYHFKNISIALHFDDITKLRKHFSLGSYPQLCICLKSESNSKNHLMHALWTIIEWKMEKHTSSSALTGQSRFELASSSYDATVELFQVDKRNEMRREKKTLDIGYICIKYASTSYHNRNPFSLSHLKWVAVMPAPNMGFFGSTLW